MAVNRYDVAAEAPIISTYVPIDFGELYRIGATQKAAVDQAAEQLSQAVRTFGEFRSPSQVDTERYYAETIGKLQPWIQQAASDPNAMKDAGWRSGLQAALNGLNYAGLSQLQESAANLRAGLQMRAQMEAEGLYNENWDLSDIANYDTLGSGAVFQDITPVKYMTANQLSNPYFVNLKPGTLDPVYKDGVKYMVTGNTIEDLEAVADAHMSDMIDTPQGRMYMREFLQRNGGNEAKAIENFRDMIVASQMARTLRPTLTVDPAWLAYVKAGATGANSSFNGWPSRLDYIQNSFTRTGNRNVAILRTQEEATEQDAKSKTLWDDYIKAKIKADQSGDPKDQIAAAQAQDKYYQHEGNIIRQYNRQAVLDGFKSAAGFPADSVDVDDNVYSNDKYLSGIQRGLKAVEQTIAITGQKEAMMTGLNALPSSATNKGGGTTRVYEFNNTQGFILPETVFRQIAGNDMPLRGEVTRHAGLFRDNSFPFQALVEQGALSNVQFIPDGGLVQNGTYDYALRGKLRIPRQQLEQYLGTGVWGNAGSENSNPATTIAAGADYLFTPLGRYSTVGNLEDKYNAKIITEKVGQDDVDYVEVDAYRQLPSTYYDSEWWQYVLQTWQNSSSSGGIGGSSQAKDSYTTTGLLDY